MQVILKQKRKYDFICCKKKRLIDAKLRFFYSILTFFLVFAFPLLPGLSSAKLVMVGLCLYLALKRDSWLKLNKINVNFKKAIRSYLSVHYFLFFWTFFLTIYYREFDFSLTSMWLSSLILYYVSFVFYTKASNYINIPKTIVYCFIFQCLLILLSMFCDTFYNISSIFRGDVDKIEVYGRLRGTAICGYQFFGLATMYSFVLLYYILHIKLFKRKILYFIFCNVFALLNGRFSIVALITGIAFYFIREILNGQLKKAISFIVIMIVFIISLIVLLYYYVDMISDPFLYKVVYNYLVQPLDSIFIDGEFRTPSTDYLQDMYESKYIQQFFIWGSGRFMDEAGGYFGSVDAGYLRILGYYGIIGFIFVFFSLFYLIFLTRSNLDIFTKIAFFCLFLAFNYKGDVQVYHNNIIPLMVAFLFFNKATDCDRSLGIVK